MAEHELTIKATLDTSQIQNELDGINKRIMTQGTNAATGGGLSNTAFKQLQMSIDQLNRTLGRIELNAKNREARASLRAATSIGGIPDASVVPMAGGWDDIGAWIKANRLSRPTKMGLHFGAVQLGNLAQQFNEGGFDVLGGITEIAASGFQGASVGSLMGKSGATIGAVLGAVSVAATKLKKAFDDLAASASALNKADEAIGRDILGRKQSQKYTELLEEGNLEELEKQLNLLRSRSKQAYDEQEQKSNMAARALEGFEAGFWNTIGRKLDWIDDPLQESADYTKQAEEAGKRGKALEAEAKALERLIDAEIKRAGDEAEKEYDDRIRWLEERKKAFEELGTLEGLRKQVLLDIQDDYLQRGVNVLSQMGKSGKYMSEMERASVSQERFSPITKRMDNMQKKLDHLQKIDRKLEKLNLGLQ